MATLQQVHEEIENAKTTGEIISIQNKNPYLKSVIDSRRHFLGDKLEMNKKVGDLYVNVVYDLQEKIKNLQYMNSGKDTLSSLELKDLQRQVEYTLRNEFEDKYLKLLEEYVGKSAKHGAEPVELYLIEGGFDVRPVNQLINRKAVEALHARTWSDGLNISDRIWNIKEGTKENLVDFLKLSQAEGRSAVDIARDLNNYVKGGRKTISPALAAKKRFPKNLDYRALRIARTEYTQSFMEGVYASGQVSPSYKGIKWLLSDAHPEPDVCDPMAGKVYKQGNEPAIPHPNCMCHQVAVHNETIEQFADRVNKWRNNPASQPDLEHWYQNVYQRIISGEYEL
jgi:hypothetical protein